MLTCRQKLELGLYRLVTGSAYVPAAEDVRTRHVRMQRICHLYSLWKGLLDYPFIEGDDGPFSHVLESDLETMDRNVEDVVMENGHPSSVLSVHATLETIELFVRPLLEGVEEDGIDRRLDMASRLAYAACSVLPGAEADRIVERAFPRPLPACGRKEALHVLRIISDMGLPTRPPRFQDSIIGCI